MLQFRISENTHIAVYGINRLDILFCLPPACQTYDFLLSVIGAFFSLWP